MNDGKRTYLVACGDLTVKIFVQYDSMCGWTVTKIRHAAGEIEVPRDFTMHPAALPAVTAALVALNVDPTRVELVEP